MNRSSYAGHRRASKCKGKRPVKGLDFDAAQTLRSDSVRGRFGNQHCQNWWFQNVPSRFPCPLPATPSQGPSLGNTPRLGQTSAHPHDATPSTRRNKTQLQGCPPLSQTQPFRPSTLHSRSSARLRPMAAPPRPQVPEPRGNVAGRWKPNPRQYNGPEGHRAREAMRKVLEKNGTPCGSPPPPTPPHFPLPTADSHDGGAEGGTAPFCPHTHTGGQQLREPSPPQRRRKRSPASNSASVPTAIAESPGR